MQLLFRTSSGQSDSAGSNESLLVAPPHKQLKIRRSLSTREATTSQGAMFLRSESDSSEGSVQGKNPAQLEEFRRSIEGSLLLFSLFFL